MSNVEVQVAPEDFVVTTEPDETTVTTGPAEPTTVEVAITELQVSVDVPQTNVAVETPVASVVAVGAQGPPGAQGPVGPPGPQGEPGLAGGVFQYEQATPSATWTVNHNLGYILPVVVLDTSGDVVEGGVEYVDVNTVVLTFSAPFAGTAYVG